MNYDLSVEEFKRLQEEMDSIKYTCPSCHNFKASYQDVCDACKMEQGEG